MNYLVTLALIVLSGGLSHATNARCYILTPSKALKEAKVVFVGKVISLNDPTLSEAPLQPRITDLERPIQVRVTVDRVYLGKETVERVYGKKLNEIEIGTRTGGLEWGYEFKAGGNYLVYAQESETEPKVLVVKGCGRTRPIADATVEPR